MKQTIALVMVVKNEEKGLYTAIDSCRPFVDEVHVSVDESSTDGTLEIANHYADKVKTFKWRDDFSWARNFAMEDVKTDWILVIDGHEFVKSFKRIDEALKIDCDALFVNVILENGFEHSSVRIFKNGVKYVGAVHNQLDFKKPAHFNTFTVIHDRENNQTKESVEARNKQRDDLVPRIMKRQILNNPSDTNALFHLTCYNHSIKKYKEALKYAKSYLKYSKDVEQRWYIRYVRSLCFIALKRHFRAFMAISMADSEIPNRWETEKIKGILFFDSKKYEKALDSLVNSFNVNKKNHLYKPLPRDDAGTWNLIGECFYNRGVLDKASIAFQCASDRASEDHQKRFFADRAKLMTEMVKGRNL